MAAESKRIIEIKDDESIFLDVQALNLILNRKEIKDMYISVVSIVGEFRGGKSFLLNFLIRYLSAKGVGKFNVSDWLAPEFGPLKGFSSAPGSQRHTTGIHMWPNIFCVEVSSGKKVAIILLDTQGTFDNQTSITQCAKIFALSTLLSSVQIYNLSKNITQYHLSHLQCFSGYGGLLSKAEAVPFQNLVFLVRDWPYSFEKPYGVAGGAVLLDEVFSATNKEVRGHIDTINKSFENINCFLMPHPGPVVGKPNFDGNLEDIDEDFKEHVKDFVTMILAPENLPIKTIDGKKITAGQLIVYLMEYCKSLEGNQMPKIETVSKATTEAQHKVAADISFEFYKKRMYCDCQLNPKCYSPSEFYNLHHENKVLAIKKFDTINKVPDVEIYNIHLIKLKHKMDKEFVIYKKINDEKIKVDEERKNVLERQRMARNDGASTSTGLTQSSFETIGTVVAGVGAGLTGAYMLYRMFSGNRRNDN